MGGIAGVDVGDVDLDDRGIQHSERVEDRYGAEAEARGIDHDRRLLAIGIVQPLDDLMLRVGLCKEKIEPQLVGEPDSVGSDVFQRRAAVQLGLALTEHVQIRAVQDVRRGHGGTQSQL